MKDLNNAGLALRAAGEMGLATRQLELLLDPITAANAVYLEGLTNETDIPPLKVGWMHRPVPVVRLDAAVWPG